MQVSKNDLFKLLRVSLGIIFTTHGLITIATIYDYINDVLEYVTPFFAYEGILIVLASLFPFILLFTGFLLISNVAIRGAIKWGAVATIFMTVVTFLSHSLFCLVWHTIMLVGLAVYYWEYAKRKHIHIYN